MSISDYASLVSDATSDVKFIGRTVRAQLGEIKDPSCITIDVDLEFLVRKVTEGRTEEEYLAKRGSRIFRLRKVVRDDRYYFAEYVVVEQPETLTFEEALNDPRSRRRCEVSRYPLTPGARQE